MRNNAGQFLKKYSYLVIVKSNTGKIITEYIVKSYKTLQEIEIELPANFEVCQIR